MRRRRSQGCEGAAAVSSRKGILRRLALLLVGAAALGGCDTSTAVFVAPGIETPALTVGKETLGTTLKGTFVLTLELASRASGPSDVGIDFFSLRNADGTQTLLASLPVAVDRALPITVAEDSEVEVTITVDTGTTLLPKELADTLCAGQVTIDGAITDTLDPSGSTVVRSQPFTLSGC